MLNRRSKFLTVPTQIAENGATSGPGVLATYAYDTLGRRSTVTRANAAGASTSYAYDAANRLYTLSQTLAGSASATYTFGYNAANQILTKQLSNSAYIASPAAITSAYTTNGLNQYTSITGATATYTPGNAATLTYDPMGGLASETAAGATNTFLYDGANLVGEYSSTGSIIGRYVPGPGVDEPVLWYQGAGTTTRSWLLSDNQGSIIGYADQSGNSDATYTYGPYGEPINSSGAPAWGGPRYRFTGQVEIPEAQLYHYKARVYDPYLGRFYQTDPAGFGGGVNIYAYAMNDPINGFDSSGNGDNDAPCPPDTADDATCLSGVTVTASKPDLEPVVLGPQGSKFTNPIVKPLVLDPLMHINCNTVLPDGLTVGDQVRAIVKYIQDQSDLGYDKLGTFLDDNLDGGPLDFKIQFGNTPFNVAVGNFAHGAVAAGINISVRRAEQGAGFYAWTHHKATAGTPYNEDAHAYQYLPLGYATNRCNK